MAKASGLLMVWGKTLPAEKAKGSLAWEYGLTLHVQGHLPSKICSFQGIVSRESNNCDHAQTPNMLLWAHQRRFSHNMRGKVAHLDRF